MKQNIFFLLLIFIGSNAIAQERKFQLNEEKDVEFKEVVNSDLSSDQLYSNAREWTTRTFQDYKNVIQLEDNNNKKLILKGRLPTNSYNKEHSIISQKIDEYINFILSIECKDNKYKYILNQTSLSLVIQTATIFDTYEEFNENESLLKKEVEINNCTTKILEYDLQLINLQAKDESNMKKKELKEHRETIAQIEKWRAYAIIAKKDLINQNNNNIDILHRLILNLKDEMNKKDSF